MASEIKRVVIKVGTSTLTASGGAGLDRVFINTLASQIAAQRGLGRQVVLVSSGAVGAGMNRLGKTRKPRTLPEKQACASVGQGLLMALYADVFANYAVPVGQVLLTRDDLRVRARYNNARNTFEALFADDVLPIVNENDTVATDEIRVGDNDTLAALVASLVDADALFLLSDVNGLYDQNPALFVDARLIERVEALTPKVQAMASGGAGTSGGTGGMQTKLAAAQIAASSGVALWIANGRRPHVLADCLAHVPQSGTYFAPAQTRLPARKRWLAWGAGTPRGTVVVNVCARRALEEEGRSLLPVGVVGVQGEFAAGEVVAVSDEAGVVFARGLSHYAASEVQALAGRSVAASSAENAPRPEIIHRDSLALLPRPAADCV